MWCCFELIFNQQEQSKSLNKFGSLSKAWQCGSQWQSVARSDISKEEVVHMQELAGHKPGPQGTSAAPYLPSSFPKPVLTLLHSLRLVGKACPGYLTANCFELHFHLSPPLLSHLRNQQPSPCKMGEIQHFFPSSSPGSSICRADSAGGPQKCRLPSWGQEGVSIKRVN